MQFFYFYFINRAGFLHTYLLFTSLVCIVHTVQRHFYRQNTTINFNVEPDPEPNFKLEPRALEEIFKGRVTTKYFLKN